VTIEIRTPLNDSVVRSLRVGQLVEISGTLYTARDAAHRRIIELLERGKQPPFPLEGQIIFYAGPSPAPPQKVVGSIGPTTSYRMDAFTVPLLERGLKATIGKGERSDEIKRALRKYGAVYFVAIGGAAALLSRHVLDCEVIAFEELGTEAVHKLRVEKFPVIVGYDCRGGDVYAAARKRRVVVLE